MITRNGYQVVGFGEETVTHPSVARKVLATAAVTIMVASVPAAIGAGLAWAVGGKPLVGAAIGAVPAVIFTAPFVWGGGP